MGLVLVLFIDFMGKLYLEEVFEAGTHRGKDKEIKSSASGTHRRGVCRFDVERRHGKQNISCPRCL